MSSNISSRYAPARINDFQSPNNNERNNNGSNV
jgi:hypothetical protein